MLLTVVRYLVPVGQMGVQVRATGSKDAGKEQGVEGRQ
jgi:hypothetical protein